MIVELCGVARLRAGRARVELDGHATSLAEALAELVDRVPGVVPEVVSEDGRLGRQFIASRNGGPFSRDPALELGRNDRVTIVGAQAGG